MAEGGLAATLRPGCRRRAFGVLKDEMGTNVSLCSLYAWSRRAERAHAKVPRNWGKNVTLLASITHLGLGLLA